MSCPNKSDVLTITETYFIELYQPLLNRTPVPAKKNTPAETVLQQTLRKLVALDIVIFGFETAIDSNLPTVYLKYQVDIWRGNEYVSNTSSVNKIIGRRQATEQSTGIRDEEAHAYQFRHVYIW